MNSYFLDPYCALRLIPQVEGAEKRRVRELPKKSGDEPKFPLLTLAALMPSAGTITLDIELR
jgi:hypothetical protein